MLGLPEGARGMGDGRPFLLMMLTYGEPLPFALLLLGSVVGDPENMSAESRADRPWQAAPARAGTVARCRAILQH